MEELARTRKQGRVTFKTHQNSSTYMNGKVENMSCWSGRAEKQHKGKGKAYAPYCHNSLEIPQSPTNAMEFLCRSWSPSASDFLHIFSSTINLPLPTDENYSFGDLHEDHDKDRELIKRDDSSKLKWGTIRKSVLPKHITIRENWEWFRTKSLSTIFKWKNNKKTKEEARLYTANLHAALSIARLAAAIAGVATNSSTNEVAWNGDMSKVVASAASLVAAVCAKAAESVGANKAHVASAVTSGLATQTPTDILALTATAATCLRGAATLKARCISHLSRNQEQVKLGAKLSVLMPSGQERDRWVSIYPKHKEIMMNIENKHLGGVLTTSKLYRIMHMMAETNEAKGCYLLSLKTNGGDIKLLFVVKRELFDWMSYISKLLHHKSALLE